MKDLQVETLQQIRILSAEMVQEANSGHPGLPLGAAPLAYSLFHDLMKYNPEDTTWFDRDRFVLSAGHGSALIYAMLYLYGYEVSMDDLKKFRQLGSKTPGHPEFWCLPGVETATGPLGAGFSNAVGMAMAEKHLSSRFESICSHRTWVLASDGDIMEGISTEAASLAGHLKLGKMVVLYDSNSISIEGGTELAFSENVGGKFKSLGWYVDQVDGSNPDKITQSVKAAFATDSDSPKLIICRTRIGQDGGDKEGKAAAHGAPLGEDILAMMRKKYGFTSKFEVKPEIKKHTGARIEQLKNKYQQWNQKFDAWKNKNPQDYKLFKQMLNNNHSQIEFPSWEVGSKEATRKSSGKILNSIKDAMPSLIGGSADLAPSNKTSLDGSNSFSAKKPEGRNLHFGIREHAMGGIVNGIALHGGLYPFGATFLVFSDYMRAALRLSSLMKTRNLWIFTHDSIFVGEDGPTHQPVEHIDALRLIPGLKVIRPADGNECVLAYKYALNHQGPVVLILSRQGLLQLTNSSRDPQNIFGYPVLAEDNPDLQLFASGSEVDLAVQTAGELQKQDYKVQVVSVPCLDLAEPEVLKGFITRNSKVVKVAIEAGTAGLWGNFGIENTIGIRKFGESGPGSDVAEYFGFTPSKIAQKLLALLKD
ncbi:MAG: transketolase [Myxococcota bacterium]